MNKIIISEEVNPYYNLALEEELLNTVEEEYILYLWQNDSTVVIGNNQNPYLECSLKKMDKLGIKLSRRLSGGGAVYHDLQNLNFTFLMKSDKINLEKEMLTIISALKMLGIDAELNSRNDIAVEGFKVSGHAYYCTDSSYYHHGTIMINVDMETLNSILTPSKYKIQTKGISSIASRVRNLKYWNDKISVSSVKDKLIASFEKYYGRSSIHTVSKKNLKLERERFYQSYDWLFGESPDYDILLEKKYPKFLLQIALSINHNRIVKAKCYTDSITSLPLSLIEVKLFNDEFQEKEILKKVDAILEQV